MPIYNDLLSGLWDPNRRYTSGRTVGTGAAPFPAPSIPGASAPVLTGAWAGGFTPRVDPRMPANLQGTAMANLARPQPFAPTQRPASAFNAQFQPRGLAAMATGGPLSTVPSGVVTGGGVGRGAYTQTAAIQPREVRMARQAERQAAQRGIAWGGDYESRTPATPRFTPAGVTPLSDRATQFQEDLIRYRGGYARY